MEELVNIPVLLIRVKWGRSSESPASRRNSWLKGVDIENRRQIRDLSRT